MSVERRGGLAVTGMRLGEALRLAWRDADLARGTITVRAAKTAAGERVIDLLPVLREQLTEYRFNTGVARHYFCARCGIYTHHQRRSNPREYGVNAACLEGVSPFDFREVVVTDGVHHPSDQPPGAPSRAVGVLRFDPAG